MAELIREEWPELDRAALAATGGRPDEVVVLIAAHTEHTRAFVRRQLAELLDLVADAPPPPPAARRSSTGRPAAPAAAPPEPPSDPIERLAVSLESHLDELTRQVKSDVAPLAVDTVRKHLGVALLLVGGLGFVLGLFLGALGFPHEPARKEGDDGSAT